MLTNTSITAIRALIFIALQREADRPVPLAEVAERTGASLSYLSKIHTQLAKANILRSFRGATGGVALARRLEDITLLEIVEACQGQILGDYCTETAQLSLVCGYHRAMVELHEGIVGTLGRWTLADLAMQPCPSASLGGTAQCYVCPDGCPTKGGGG